MESPALPMQMPKEALLAAIMRMVELRFPNHRVALEPPQASGSDATEILVVTRPSDDAAICHFLVAPTPQALEAWMHQPGGEQGTQDRLVLVVAEEDVWTIQDALCEAGRDEVSVLGFAWTPTG